jgi:hypothetical protein
VRDEVKIAIIGGGVAGASTALSLSSLGLNVTLFEKETSLVNGPPFCHLHAGGNLYPDISDDQCLKLLEQSVDFVRFYPEVVDFRPTVIAFPKTCDILVEDRLPRLKKLQAHYREMIIDDSNNEVLGESDAYFKLYSKERVEALRSLPVVDQPTTDDEWMISVAQNLDTHNVQFPLILVQEYGLNLFRLGASVTLSLQNYQNAKIELGTTVIGVKEIGNGWLIDYEKDGKIDQGEYDYLINAAGFRSGKIDDMLDIRCQSMVEFKAAYVAQWYDDRSRQWPELIIHGKRGSKAGMRQFTPYPNGYFQLHGMTTDITLYEDGLAKSSMIRCQPQLEEKFIKKIDHNWSVEEITERTERAVRHLAEYLPAFGEAKVASKPLFGAQQIPGNDPSLRVAEVSFPKERYAKCEIVKVSSVIDMIEAIVDDLQGYGYIGDVEELIAPKKESEERIVLYAKDITDMRNYPSSLSQRSVFSR